jgi:hypothetical protein
MICHDRLVEQELEFVAQAHGPRDAPTFFQRIVAGQQERVNRRDLFPDLLVGRKEGHLLDAS